MHDQVYPPQEDSWLLLRAACKWIRPGDKVLEIGTGSGIVAASLPPCHLLVATDINPYAVHEAYARGVPVIRTTMNMGIRECFDLVLFNPPYLPTPPSERCDDWLECALDGGADGNEVIRIFIALLPGMLCVSGSALLLISSLNGTGIVGSICDENELSWRTVERDLLPDGEELSVLLITRNR